MLQEKQWYAETLALLKDQLSFLKTELIHKNNLIIELSTRSNNDSTSTVTHGNNSSNLNSFSESLMPQTTTSTISIRRSRIPKTPTEQENFNQSILNRPADGDFSDGDIKGGNHLKNGLLMTSL